MVRERIDIKSTGGRTEIWVKRPAGVTSRVIGFKVEADDLFVGTGATQSRAMRIQGDRAATAVMGGDAHDFLLELTYTNYAVNTPAGSYARALSIQTQNRDSGAIGSLQGALISTRQRGDGALAAEQMVLRVDLNHDVGGTAATGLQEGIRVNMKILAAGPTHADTTGAAGITVNNDASGSYNNKADAFKVRSLGQPFRYLLDFYDSRVKLDGTAIMRLPVVDSGSLPAIWACGTATDDSGIVSQVGADSLWADGSLYSSIADGAGKLFIKTNDVWTSAI